MRLSTAFALLACVFFAGCLTAEEQRAADEAKCRSYGFTRKNDAFAECLQRIDLARRAELYDRSFFDDDWYDPVIIYRPGPVYGPRRR